MRFYRELFAEVAHELQQKCWEYESGGTWEGIGSSECICGDTVWTSPTSAYT
jgi:hypothetical protein